MPSRNNQRPHAQQPARKSARNARPQQARSSRSVRPSAGARPSAARPKAASRPKAAAARPKAGGRPAAASRGAASARGARAKAPSQSTRGSRAAAAASNRSAQKKRPAAARNARGAQGAAVRPSVGPVRPKRDQRVKQTKPPQAQARPSAYDAPTPEAAMVTRRRFLVGGAAAAAVAVVGGAAVAASQQSDAPTIETLSVSTDDVFTIDSCTQVDASSAFKQEGSYSLPYGTLIWSNDDAFAACLLPTDTASPLAQGALLNLATGKYETVLKNANGASDGFEVYDFRATSQGAVWIEANIFENQWRVLAGSLSNGSNLQNTRIVDEGDSSIETPAIAAVGSHAYWICQPPSSASDAKSTEAQLKRASFSSGDAEVVYGTAGRMACAPYAASDGVVIAPRHPDSTRYYQLVRVADDSGQATDAITLPSSMKPTEVGWGPNGFSFCFESIYSYGDGIANMGTYAPAQAHSQGASYDGGSWFRFGRTPSAEPAWCGNSWLMLKSTQAVVGVNVDNRTYCTFDVPSGPASWGDYLCTTGVHSRIVTAAQVGKATSEATGQSDSTSDMKCSVRVWKTI